jgi:hypothetical protein
MDIGKCFVKNIYIARGQTSVLLFDSYRSMYKIKGVCEEQHK